MNALPKRKNIRLKEYDYSTPGVYFVTICTQHRRCILSRVVGRGLAPAALELTDYGKVAEQELLSLEMRYPFLKVDAYAIMPNHIHVLFVIENETAGASPRPTISDVVCAYKSLTTRKCKKIGRIDKVFQTSFHDHVIRDQSDYDDVYRYIETNPTQWELDEFYTQ